jgi:predicted TIM-barrel fold metal-dependent hydrolase
MHATGIPRIISVDDHVVEPPDLWVSRVPSKYRDRAPHVEYLPEGETVLVGTEYVQQPGDEGKPVAWWCYEGSRQTLKRVAAAAGYPKDEAGYYGIRYDEMRPGCWKPKDRVADMDLNHVDMSLCFPNYPRFCGQIFYRAEDKELALLCIKAYNDWIIEEWGGESDGRLLGVCLIPLWDSTLAIEEVRRNAARGARAVAFSEIPPWLGLPSIYSGYWDPLFAACAETGTVVGMHTGSATKVVRTSDDAPEIVPAVSIFTNTAYSMLDFIFSGVLQRFPDLKLLYAESQIGWIPYVLERADDAWDTHRAWAIDHKVVPLPPSTYYYRNIYSSFFRDHSGIAMLDKVGVDNICFETDFPHCDSTWPETKQVAEELFGHLPDDVVYKITRGNAERLLNLT